MAEIDKGLPNVKRPDEVAEEVNVTEIDETPKGPVEITEDEEGATVDFDPMAMPLPTEVDHFANLNELLDAVLLDSSIVVVFASNLSKTAVGVTI